MAGLTEEQKAAYDASLRGESMFLTGPGGTGKSYLLHAIYEAYQNKTGKKIVITAMTGCAANLLGCHAKTLHSWAGIGLGRGAPLDIVERVRNFYPARQAWRNVGALVIDEVSMMKPQLLDLLDLIAKSIRRNEKPFGGIQMILVGDFCQLPPVSTDGEEIQYAFQSRAWRAGITHTYPLTQVIRQSDPVFQRILADARRGILSDDSYAILAARKTDAWKRNTIRPTMLFTKRADVAAINDRYMARLTGERRVFEARTLPSKHGGAALAKIVERMDRDMNYEPRLELVVGCQVMLVCNKDPENGLVNGSRGILTGFSDAGQPMVLFLRHTEPTVIAPHVWESDDKDPVQREQIPLRIAYAITIHKAQGATLDCALIDIGKSTFEYGQAYVALSRVKSLDSLYVYDLDPAAFRLHPLVREFYGGFARATQPLITEFLITESASVVEPK